MKISFNGIEHFIGQGGLAWQPGQPTLVLQHGAGMDRTIWVLFARYFSRRGFNVVAADLPGHGATGGEALESIESQSMHLWALLDELQSVHGLPDGQLTLAGHSMGSLIALEAASQRPEMVEQLVLLGAGYPMPVGQALLDAAKANDQSAVDLIAIFSHNFGSQLGHNPLAGISVQNLAMALLERARPDVLYKDLSACNAYDGGEAAAQTLVDKPCTVIAGIDDRMTPMRAARTLQGLLDAKLLVLKNCGHMMTSEQPEATLQALKSCLETD